MIKLGEVPSGRASISDDCLEGPGAKYSRWTPGRGSSAGSASSLIQTAAPDRLASGFIFSILLLVPHGTFDNICTRVSEDSERFGFKQ